MLILFLESTRKLMRILNLKIVYEDINFIKPTWITYKVSSLMVTLLGVIDADFSWKYSELRIDFVKRLLDERVAVVLFSSFKLLVYSGICINALLATVVCLSVVVGVYLSKGFSSLSKLLD